MRKTKIICTLGPATDGILPEMIKAGMNVARMNFSHGSHEEHKARMDAVKAARKELGMPVGIMLDTKGPEIRTKTYKDGKIEIVEGQEFTLTTRDIEGDNTIVSITYEGLPNDVQPGTRILIDDGLVAFEVLKIVDGTDIIYHSYFDIGVAVGTERGLVVPVVRNADQKSFAQIELEIADFAKRAQAGKLSIEELSGGTFTVSNGGVFGSMLSTPIINPPQSAILGIHATKERPVVVNGEIVIRPMNYLALSYDHRLIDGREAVLGLGAMKAALEDPTVMLLDI